MRILSRPEAKTYLEPLKVEIGNWNEIRYSDSKRVLNSRWVKYRAPDHPYRCYLFSLFFADWTISVDQWILQLDNSNQFTFNQAATLSRIITDSSRIIDFNAESQSTFLFEVKRSSVVDERLRLSNVIYLMTIFSGHGYFISPADGGDHIGIHDGYVYVIAQDGGLARAQALIDGFEKETITWPRWLREAELSWQERALGGDHI